MNYEWKFRQEDSNEEATLVVPEGRLVVGYKGEKGRVEVDIFFDSEFVYIAASYVINKSSGPGGLQGEIDLVDAETLRGFKPQIEALPNGRMRSSLMCLLKSLDDLVLTPARK